MPYLTGDVASAFGSGLRDFWDLGPRARTVAKISLKERVAIGSEGSLEGLKTYPDANPIRTCSAARSITATCGLHASEGR